MAIIAPTRRSIAFNGRTHTNEDFDSADVTDISKGLHYLYPNPTPKPCISRREASGQTKVWTYETELERDTEFIRLTGLGVIARIHAPVVTPPTPGNGDR